MEETKEKNFKGNYFQWIVNQVKTGMNTPATAIWFFGVGFQLALLLTGTINLLTIITFLASTIGLLCTVMLMNGKPINGLFGFISAFGFIFVNWQAQHWWSCLDQVVFIVAIDLPLMINWRKWDSDFEEKVRTLNKKGWIVAIISILILWGLLYPAAIYLHDSQPLIDALVLAVGAVASVLCFLKFNNTYTLWLFSNIINVILWFASLQNGNVQTALPMLVTTILYMSTAIYGKFFSIWKNGNKNKN